MAAVVLLDRDGVINYDRPDSVKSLAELIILPGVVEALCLLHQADVRAIVVTNQACVGRGALSMAQLEQIHHYMVEQVEQGGGRIDAIYCCPHAAGVECDCRKPLPGLIHQAQRDWGFNRATTWMVGDAGRDIEAARSAGCLPALVRTGKGIMTAPHYADVPLFDNLNDFVCHYLAEKGPCFHD
ncbi:MAG: HAD-IIIA family hydrolase [Magnetococcales bacterium]|nr:HAD-IIIA family hydrolase [Magnetococcales bacterium]